AGSRVLVHRLLDELLGLAHLARQTARHRELDRGLAVHGGRLEVELERQLRARGRDRRGLERFGAPLALRAGDERALERRLARRLEVIYERRAEQPIGGGEAEQICSRLVGVDENA